MAGPTRKKSRKKPSGSPVAAFALFFLIVCVVAGYLLLSPPGKSGIKTKKPELSRIKPAEPYPSRETIPQGDFKEPSDVAPSLQKLPSPIISEPEKPRVGIGSTIRLAIIIDDMGKNLSEARSLAAIDVPLTFAIIPGLRFDKEVAAYAASNKIETMIHVPMQSKGWPSRRLEANGLLLAMSDDELQERMSGFVDRLPGAVGVNNHMGSEFTEHEDKMTDVLKILKKNNLFFIDSLTSQESAGLRVAQRLGVRSARRHVFLDNVQERGYIMGQLNQAVRSARENGSAIAICHPHPATIAALKTALPKLAAQGVLLVPASQLVR